VNYAANLTKTINKIIAEAPDVQEKAKRDNEAPQKLQDRNLNTALNKTIGHAKTVKTHCDNAVEKAGKGDASGAQAELKAAAAALKDLQGISSDYDKIVKDYKDHVENSKDKAKILGAVQRMNKNVEDSSRLLRGIATTIKKAG
jgi:hypothetical protein